MPIPQLSVEDQIKLLELGIETQILTEEDIIRLADLGLITLVGNVDIGTLSPTQKLQVNRNITIPDNHNSTDFDK